MAERAPEGKPAGPDGSDPVPVTFPGLSRVPGLAHGVFTRHGGVSQPPFATLNAAWNDGDSPDAVSENLRRIRRSLRLDFLVSSVQVHGDGIHVVDTEAMSRYERQDAILRAPDGDALVTRAAGVGLLIKIADCQAIFLVDPVRRVTANVHSGWRGTVQDIASKTVRLLQDRFGSRPEDLYAAVSPSLGPCCGEFRNFPTELPPSFLPFQVKPFHFDFWAITRHQLQSVGIRPENIEIAQRCTVCEPRDFFSYRGERTTGRMAAVIGWREQSTPRMSVHVQAD